MQGTEDLITHLYRAFNERDIDGALELMSDAVDWPKATEGGRVTGKDGVRAYWTRQWAELDPHVDPLRITDRDAGRVLVTVHQVVKDRAGAMLFDGTVWHVFTLEQGLVQRMDVHESESTIS